MGLYLIMLGVQGAGKGMQAGLIAQRYNIPHVSTGDMFRAMKTREDELARRVQEIMAAGGLIDDDTTNAVVADRLSQPDAVGGAILDGYPRNQDQADFLANFLAARGEVLSAVLLMKLDLYVAFKRAFGRVTSASGESYNIYFRNEGLRVEFIDHPEQIFPARVQATLEATGEILQRRPDDANAAAIIKRIDTYLTDTRPLIEYYTAAGLLHEVDADRSIEDVQQEISRIIEATARV